MYEQIKDYFYALKRQITVKRCIIGAICLLLFAGFCSFVDGYFTARGNYQRAIERLEQAQRELERSKQLNRELQQIIERSTILNDEAGRGIERIEDYQRRTEQGIDRAQSYQREASERIAESLHDTQRARELLERNLQLIDGVERRNQEQQTDGATPASPAGHLGDQ